MIYFSDREELTEWLEPLDYETFWREIAIFNLERLPLPPKEDCDAQIAAGTVTTELVLSVLKNFARLSILDQQKLKPRDLMPDMLLH